MEDEEEEKMTRRKTNGDYKENEKKLKLVKDQKTDQKKLNERLRRMGSRKRRTKKR